eukprot:14597689-Alexandrium_andersonii.AAC.1
MLSQIEYQRRVSERRRPVVLRPLTSSDPGCWLRLASLSTESAERCCVRAGGALEAVARAAHRWTGNRFTAQ